MSWVDPPPKLDLGAAEWQRSASRVIGMSRFGNLSNADLGELVERALARELGLDRYPGTAFDLQTPDGQTAYEVKACSVGSGEYKIKAKGAEMRAKAAEASARGITPAVVIAIVDAAGVIYAYARDGLGAFRLTGPERGWRFLGTARLELAT